MPSSRVLPKINRWVVRRARVPSPARESDQPATMAYSGLTRWERRVGYWILLLRVLAARSGIVATNRSNLKSRFSSLSYAFWTQYEDENLVTKNIWRMSEARACKLEAMCGTEAASGESPQSPSTASPRAPLKLRVGSCASSRV